MKVLIITVAGMSTRFSQSVGAPCLKCLYHEGRAKDSLLYRMLHQDGKFDRYVIVGGVRGTGNRGERAVWEVYGQDPPGKE